MGELEITIQRKMGRFWPVVVERSADGGALPVRVESRFEIDKDQLLLIPEPLSYGMALGRSLFGDPAVRDCLVSARGGGTLHVLLFVEAEDLRVLRWERLCAPVDAAANSGWDFLSLNAQTPFALHLPAAIDRRFPPIVHSDLRALVVASSPNDLLGRWKMDPFNVREAVERTVAALAPIPCDVLASGGLGSGPPTLEEIAARLVATHYPLLHIVCHGKSVTIKESLPDDSGEVRTVERGDTVLFLESEKANEQGNTKAVTGTRLLDHLGKLHGARGLPRFTFLASCQTAVQVEGAALSGLAQRLVRELGMPAVLAMTENLEVNLAGELVRRFYPELARAGFVDLAFAAAGAVLAGRPGVNVPVLYSRLGGRPLFGERGREPLPEETIRALERVAGLLAERAPVFLPAWGDACQVLRTQLAREESTLSPPARRERERALQDASDTANQICEEALDLRFDALVFGATPDPLPHGGRCPFRGLLAYDLEDQPFFFGRKTLVERLKKTLGKGNFLAVLGPSGSGKSSVVLAGLLPALGVDRAGVAYLRPGTEPVGALDQALSGRTARVLVVDQFEELFTACPTMSLRREFLKRLLDLRERLPLVVTMRADFWGECATHARLKSLMRRRQELVGPMKPGALRRAIEQQAQAAGLRFEAGLAGKIVEEVTGEPGSMPLLQHALVNLWERRHGRWLRLNEYLATGGVRRAIAQSADAFFLGLPTDEARDRVRNIFLRLTKFDDDSGTAGEARHTRRRVSLEELRGDGDDLAGIERLVNQIADARLVVTKTNPSTGRREVEVAHEALIQHWPRLGEWLESHRLELRLREGLRRSAREWESSGRKDVFLIHLGARLREAQGLLTGARLPLNDLEREYLDECRALASGRQVTYEAEIRVFASADEEHRVEMNIPELGKSWQGRLDGRSLKADPDLCDAEKAGEALGRAVFADGAIGRPFRESLAAVRGRGGRLRVRLRVDDTVLGRLAWERLCQPAGEGWSPLATDPALPFSRYLPGRRWEPTAAVLDRPVRVLGVTASPQDLASFGVLPIPPEEREGMRKLFLGLPDVSLRWLEGGTADPPNPANLQRALSEGCNILYYLGYSLPTPDGRPGLVLEGDDRQAVVWTTAELVGAIRASRTRPVLCVVAMQDGLFLVPPLIKDAGVGAVVASTLGIRFDTLGLFTRRFVPRLLEHGLADLAFNEARGFVRVRRDWHKIQLVSHCEQNRVLEVSRGRPGGRPGAGSRTQVQLHLRIGLGPDGRFAVELSPPGHLEMEPCGIDLDLEGFRSFHGTPGQYGEALGRTVFADDAVRLPFQESLAAVRGRGGRLRVRLRLDDPRLGRLAWERLCYPVDGRWLPLAADPALPFSRYLPGAGWEQSAALSDRPVRVLAVAASPPHLESYGVTPIPAGERSDLRRLLEGLPEVSVKWLETGTPETPYLANLQQALADGCHILHIHVPFRSLDSEEQAVVFLEGLYGEAKPVPIQSLVDLINTAADPPLFCFLTGPPDPRGAFDDDGYRRVARAIVEGSGVQIAAALTIKLGDAGAVDFLRTFYETLFKTGQVDVAMSAARLASAPGLDPGRAVLFSQRSDNTILDV